MVWCSGWRLVSAVSNNGGLGLIGSGSMYPDVLREHIKKKVSSRMYYLRPLAIGERETSPFLSM